MSHSSDEKIILYTSRWCGHSMMVERLLDNNNVPVQKINIDGDDQARAVLIELNGGYASVPTLVFPDGTKLTEPSSAAVRAKLELEPAPGLMSRIRDVLGRGDSGDD